MKHCSLLCSGVWPFLLLPLLLLPLVLSFVWKPIEQSVAENARQSLLGKQDWATIETFNRGRDVLLTGMAPSAYAVAQAQELAMASEGVRIVGFMDAISAPTMSEFGFAFEGNKILLTGLVNKQSEIEDILNLVSAKYPDKKIINGLKTANTEGSLPWAKLVAGASGLPEGFSLSIVGDTLTLVGLVGDEKIRRSIERKMQTAFSGEIDNRLGVTAAPALAVNCLTQIQKLLSATKIYFQPATAKLRKENQALLQSMVKVVQDCPVVAFEVSGHTDATGNATQNMLLSEQRAQAVVNFLVNADLDPDRFSVVGYGSQRAIADNSTRAGRAINRRIEFKIRN